MASTKVASLADMAAAITGAVPAAVESALPALPAADPLALVQQVAGEVPVVGDVASAAPTDALAALPAVESLVPAVESVVPAVESVVPAVTSVVSDATAGLPVSALPVVDSLMPEGASLLPTGPDLCGLPVTPGDVISVTNGALAEVSGLLGGLPVAGGLLGSTTGGGLLGSVVDLTNSAVAGATSAVDSATALPVGDTLAAQTSC